MKTKQLHFKWTVSRGQNTYGYNICTLLVDGEKKGQCNGGGYDMKGTSFASWITSDYQSELLNLFASELEEFKTSEKKWDSSKNFYGTHFSFDKKGNIRVSLDGASGFSSIERIVNAIGIKLQWNPESNRYKSHEYFTAIFEEKEVNV
jgi:hypothetical protein